MNKEQQLREAIIKAVPEVEKGYTITEIHREPWAKVRGGSRRY